ncbi:MULTISPECIES: hypothetical protein [unclassified Crossiella]|uniref:hypothetical protein n=1 Tax=unclassified Crossiella TaxID=2620835 RepID=UPI001FFE4F30|nr:MULTISPECIES: hypothetical protein [unclassified Crossiella]MCK2239997.1 hypothetical protein [Crossiella sp. S99.2]MCK2252705.1 hypothetical protein [Crossiella sp. S99.1]
MFPLSPDILKYVTFLREYAAFINPRSDEAQRQLDEFRSMLVRTYPLRLAEVSQLALQIHPRAFAITISKSGPGPRELQGILTADGPAVSADSPPAITLPLMWQLRAAVRTLDFGGFLGDVGVLGWETYSPSSHLVMLIPPMGVAAVQLQQAQTAAMGEAVRAWLGRVDSSLTDHRRRDLDRRVDDAAHCNWFSMTLRTYATDRRHGPDREHIYPHNRFLDIAGSPWPASSPEECTAEDSRSWYGGGFFLLCNGCGLDCT